VRILKRYVAREVFKQLRPTHHHLTLTASPSVV
jgi:hypothetical protein